MSKTPKDTTASEPADFFEQVAQAAAEDLPQILERMREIAKDGGRKNVRIKCSHCGQFASTDVDVYDAEELRKLMESYASIQLRAKAQRSEDDASKEGRRILKAIEDMSNEEIATELAALEREGEGLS